MRPNETSTATSDPRERTLRASVAAFLRAERSDDASASGASETALRSLFRALPSPFPSREFAARVLAAMPLRPVVRHVRDLAPRHRWLVAAAALCAALVAAYLLPVTVLVLGRVEWGALVAACGAVFGHLVSGLYGLAVFGRAALSLLQAFWLFLGSPQVLFTLILATSVLGLCIRLLTGLIHSPRDPAHASL